MRSVVLLARFADELVDGFLDLGCVLGDEADGFAIDEEAVFTDGGFDGKILLRRDTGELGELEVDRAEAVEEVDEEVGVGGGAASGDSPEGAALAEKAAEVEDRAGVGGDF